MKRKKPTLNLTASRLLPALLIVLVLYAVLPQLGAFRDSLQLLQAADRQYVLWAAVCISLTFLLAAATYCLLSLKRLSYARTLVAQVAGMFADRLLPAGIGGIGVNYAYLRGCGQKPAAAFAVVATSSALGIVGHLLLVAGVIALLRPEIHGQAGVHWPAFGWKYALLAIVALIIAIAAWRFWPKLKRNLAAILRQMLAYRAHPGRLSAALVSSMLLTSCNVLGFYFCCQALGIPLSAVQLLLIFSLGILLGTATPTPGGLGGVEVGLFAGLVAYHIDAAMALATVLIFRLVSYWLPLIIGSAFFVYATRRGYFKL